MTPEQFRSEFATEAGRRRLGYAPNQERQDRVDRILADDFHFRQIFQQWQTRQRKVRAAEKRERRAAWGRAGIIMLLAGLALAVTAANIVSDHTQRVGDGPCYERPHLYSDETTTVCPAHTEPIYDGYRATWSLLGWGVGGGLVVAGLVLAVRHPRF
jgi:hypothetical protein